MWRWAALVLVLAGGVACSDAPPASAVSPAAPVTVPTAGQAGATAPPSAAGAGASAPAAGSGGSSAPDAGMRDGAAGIPAACRIPDNLPLIDADADGGLAKDCYEVPRRIIRENCIGFCHHDRPAPSGGLNLASPCIADRLINVRSRCQDLLYVDTAQPERSFVLDKVLSQQPRCGASMPDGWHLPPEQQACVEAWVHAIIRASR